MIQQDYASLKKALNSEQALGFFGENIVKDYLCKNGFIVVKANYKTKVGEIDLIAKKDDLLVFVEVKSRSNKYFNIGQVVNSCKQMKISKTARHFLAYNPGFSDFACRFDVATVQIGKPIEYIANAFYSNIF